VQKWKTGDIKNIAIEKSKHVHIDVGGSSPINLHFNAGSKDSAEAIASKLEASKELSIPSINGDRNEAPSVARVLPPLRTDLANNHKPIKKGVHFSASSPVVIPPREPSDDEEEAPEHDVDEHGVSADDGANGDLVKALYDFDADGDDELSVKEGEQLVVLEKDGDEWWKCRNSMGVEGVVPASYLEVCLAYPFTGCSYLLQFYSSSRQPAHTMLLLKYIRTLKLSLKTTVLPNEKSKSGPMPQF
jgi:actin cytoskeleton-regulatory complex protein SLA1